MFLIKSCFRKIILFLIYALFPVLFVGYSELLKLIMIVPPYYVASLWIDAIKFSLIAYFKWSFTIGWTWNSINFLRLFVLQVILGQRPRDDSDGLAQLNDIKNTNMMIFSVAISLLYMHPLVSYLHQEYIFSNNISIFQSIVVSLFMFIDASTFNFFTTYEISFPMMVEFNKGIIAKSFIFLTNSVFSIVTIALVWGGLRELLRLRLAVNDNTDSKMANEVPRLNDNKEA